MTQRTEPPAGPESEFRRAFEMLSDVAGKMLSSTVVGLSPQDVARCFLGVSIGCMTAVYGDHATVAALRSMADALEAGQATAQ